MSGGLTSARRGDVPITPGAGRRRPKIDARHVPPPPATERADRLVLKLLAPSLTLCKYCGRTVPFAGSLEAPEPDARRPAGRRISSPSGQSPKEGGVVLERDGGKKEREFPISFLKAKAQRSLPPWVLVFLPASPLSRLSLQKNSRHKGGGTPSFHVSFRLPVQASTTCGIIPFLLIHARYPLLALNPTWRCHYAHLKC